MLYTTQFVSYNHKYVSDHVEILSEYAFKILEKVC